MLGEIGNQQADDDEAVPESANAAIANAQSIPRSNLCNRSMNGRVRT